VHAPAAGVALPATRLPLQRRACGPTGGESGFAPYPSPPLAAPHPIPNTCAPLRGHPAFCRLALSCSARWAVLTHILKCRVAVPRRTPVLLDGLAPPGWGRVPPTVLTDGLSPPARRVPPMHLAAHSVAVQVSATRDGFSSVGHHHGVQQVKRSLVPNWVAVKAPFKACPDPSIAIEYDQPRARKRRNGLGKWVRQRRASSCCAKDVLPQQVI